MEARGLTHPGTRPIGTHKQIRLHDTTTGRGDTHTMGGRIQRSKCVLKPGHTEYAHGVLQGTFDFARLADQIGRASCRERVCQYVEISVVAVSLKKKLSTHTNNYTNKKTI